MFSAYRFLLNTKFKKHGENYLALSGEDGNYASTLDAAALDVIGDIDLRVQVAPDKWTPTLSDYFAFVSKWDSASNQRQYTLNMQTNGKLRLVWSSNGTSSLNATSTVVIGIKDGHVKWLRGTLDVNDGAGNRVIKFYTSDNGIYWTQLGDTITVAATTSIYSSGTFRVTIGPHDSEGTGGNQPGKIYRAQIYDGIDGTLVFDADFTKEKQGVTSFVESSSQGATVTITT